MTGSADDISRLNELLDSEPGSTLWVDPAEPNMTPVDSNLPGMDRGRGL